MQGTVANSSGFIGGSFNIPSDATAIAQHSVPVYTTDEIDAKIGVLNTSLTRVTSTNGLVDQRVAQAEQRIKDQLKTSIDAIPQRLLSKEAQDGLKAAVLADLKTQLDQLRSDLQGQIDQSKKS